MKEKKNQLIIEELAWLLYLLVLVYFCLEYFFLGSVLKGVGALVAAIGLGQIIAGYLYPNTSEELTNAVEEFEKI
jgi:hypothetical protein